MNAMAEMVRALQADGRAAAECRFQTKEKELITTKRAFTMLPNYWIWEIRSLQAGECRRGSNASQYKGCCLDSSIYAAVRGNGSRPARQQFAILQGEVNKVFDVPHQTATATSVHVLGTQSGKEQSAAGGEGEDKRRRS